MTPPATQPAAPPAPQPAAPPVIPPQIVPPFIGLTIYRWDINVRMSTIIGFVGGGGIGYILKPRVDLGEWGEVGTLVLLIAATVWLMDILSAKIRERIA